MLFMKTWAGSDYFLFPGLPCIHPTVLVLFFSHSHEATILVNRPITILTNMVNKPYCHIGLPMSGQTILIHPLRIFRHTLCCPQTERLVAFRRDAAEQQGWYKEALLF